MILPPYFPFFAIQVAPARSPLSHGILAGLPLPELRVLPQCRTRAELFAAHLQAIREAYSVGAGHATILQTNLLAAGDAWEVEYARLFAQLRPVPWGLLYLKGGAAPFADPLHGTEWQSLRRGSLHDYAYCIARPVMERIVKAYPETEPCAPSPEPLFETLRRATKDTGLMMYTPRQILLHRMAANFEGLACPYGKGAPVTAS